MASHPDRSTLIRKPPRGRRGRRHWTADAAAEAIGHVSSAEVRVRMIRELASDDGTVIEVLAA